MWGLVIFLCAGEMLRASSSQEKRVHSWVCARSTALTAEGHTVKQISDGKHLVTSITDARGQLQTCALQGQPAEVRPFISRCTGGASPGSPGLAITDLSAGPQEMKDPGLMGSLGDGYTKVLEPGGTEGSELMRSFSINSTIVTPVSHDGEFLDFESAKLACQVFLTEGGTVASEEQAHHPGQASLHRSRRGFTYPGTLWCGAGNSAESYHELGELKETDACCREHDHCQHVIHPFAHNYGYRNLRWHTISHCACDNEMKDCLRKVNSTASRVVGQAFFNVIQVPCFEFMYQDQCMERFWYGWCKTYSKVAVAVPQTPVLYDYGGELIDLVPTTKTKTEKPLSTSTLSSSTTSLPGIAVRPHETTSKSSNYTDWSIRTTTKAHRTTSHPPRTTSRTLRNTSHLPRTTASTRSTTSHSPRKTYTPSTTSRSPSTTAKTPTTISPSSSTTTTTPAITSQSLRILNRAPATTSQPHKTTIRALGTTTRQPEITAEQSPGHPSIEPTLGQVIQATEDLLKFMMTTMSPSTYNDAKTDGASKRQRKNKKRKKGKKEHRKGKGRKGKKTSLSKSGVLAPTSWALTPTTAIPEKDLWVESMEKVQERELQHLMLDLGGKQDGFNDVLNDEPGRDEAHLFGSIAILPSQMPTLDPAKKSITTATEIPVTAVKEPKKGRRKNRNRRKRLRENSWDSVL